MKKVLLIIVVFAVMLAGCGSHESTAPLELISVKITATPGEGNVNKQVAIIELRDTALDKNFILIEFDPDDDLKKVIEALPIGQKMHLKCRYLHNANFLYKDPYYQRIGQIILIPSGEKYSF